MPAIPTASLVAAAASAKQNRPLLVIVILMVGSLAVLLLLPSVLQNQSYHGFADARTVLGVPNFWNVVSNIPFMIVGAVGLARCRHDAATTIVFAGIFLTGFGSSYYHWAPDDGTLFWYRLPMAVAFMAILAGAVGERVSAKAGAILLWPLLALGVVSLLVWRWSGDLRLYGWVQFFPVLILPPMFVLLPPKYSGTGYWIAAAGLYLLAKLFEYFEAAIYSFLGHALSGHTLKHLAAAAACFCILRYFQARQPVAYAEARKSAT